MREGNRLITENEDALRQTGHARIHVLDALDEDCAGGTADDLPVAEAVGVGVVPVQARGLIRRDLHRVVKGVPGLDQRGDDLVLVAGGWHVQAVEMQVRDRRSHRPAVAVIVRTDRARPRLGVGMHLIPAGIELPPVGAVRVFWRWMISWSPG